MPGTPSKIENPGSVQSTQFKKKLMFTTEWRHMLIENRNPLQQQTEHMMQNHLNE